ncbi:MULTISPECIES: porin [Myroides]|uniref:Porin n=1 Tax=Myroides albus TaxID=2562892 RepID=A0A6I3LNP7_9FLAO|nr:MULTISPECIES: porin [Myroides]MTG98940.1 porin [Myroides albus]MVX36682.1 porin [Myroides sp. LoEW2-1]UVD78592.1 OprO/OprP family phosphate-selective porin [Myroides albus]
MKKIYTIIVLLFSMTLFAQEEKKIETNNDMKLAQLPYYNFGKGLGMTSADSLFQLNIRFRMQNRLTAISNQDESTKYEGEIRRLRLRFDGYVGNPKFLYVIQLSFTPKDMGTQKDGQSPNIIRDAALTYRPNSNWNFIFGQTKLPGNRQRTNSSGALQLTDRSINNAKFNIDRDFGIQAYYLQEKGDNFGYNVKTAVSTGRGRNWSGSESDSYALTGRVELFPFGSFKNNGAFFEGDLARETSPKLMVAGTFSYNNNAERTQGQTGDNLYEARSFRAIMGDAILKYNGWAAMLSYMSRNLSDPITYLQQDAGEPLTRSVYAGHGLDYQLSYVFPSNYELIGRVSTQTMHDDLYKQLNMPNTTEFTLGATKYLWEHAFKIQAELTYDKLTFNQGSSKNNWYFRLQFEIGI